MLGRNARTFRSEPKMERPTRRISTVQFLHSISWNWWRNDRVRVEYFPRTHFIWEPPQDPKRPARSKHWTWKVWRTDHPHVNVQWHRLDEERKFRKMYFKFRTSQELREEILAGALDIPRSRWRKEVVRNSPLHAWRKMRFCRHRDGATFQRIWSPSIQEQQCFESWNSESTREEENRSVGELSAVCSQQV